MNDKTLQKYFKILRLEHKKNNAFSIISALYLIINICILEGAYFPAFALFVTLVWMFYQLHKFTKQIEVLH